MYIIGAMALIAAVALGLIVGGHYTCSWYRNHVWRPQIEWARKILKSNDDKWKAAQKQPDNPEGFWGSPHKSPDIVKKGRFEHVNAQRRVERRRRQEAARQALESARAETHVARRFAGYKDLPVWDLGTSLFDAARKEQREAAIGYATHLLAQVRTNGNDTDFVCLVELVTSPYPNTLSTYREMTGVEYAEPLGWMAHVAMVYERPWLSLYRSRPENFVTLGHQARDKNSLALAKYVLAQYDEHEDARRDIGIVLATELANMVTRLHDQRALVFNY